MALFPQQGFLLSTQGRYSGCTRQGSHTLTCVQRLIEVGIPFKTIGDYMGYRSPSSTQIYTKVSIEALRKVALGEGDDILL